MNILEKYESIRNNIQDGDIILFHGTKWLAKLIQSSDKNEDGTWARHNHTGIIFEKHGALFILDSNGDGVQADRLYWRIASYKNGGDFTIIRPLKSKVLVDLEMQKLLKRSDEKWIKYDFVNGSKELLNRRFGMNFKIKLSDSRVICSQNDAQYAINLNMVNSKFKEKTIVFPEDYIRYINTDCAEIIT